MSYTFSKVLDIDYESAIAKVTAALKDEGFGIITEIDMKTTLKNKINVDIHPYKILGACNPHFAHQALLAENEIGSMLPCNVVVQETNDGKIKVSAIDPVASMMAVQNNDLADLAIEVRQQMEKVISNL